MQLLARCAARLLDYAHRKILSTTAFAWRIVVTKLGNMPDTELQGAMTVEAIKRNPMRLY